MPDVPASLVTHCSFCGRKIRKKGEKTYVHGTAAVNWVGHAANPPCRRYGQPPDATYGEAVRGA
jgi:hypothetical protein